MKARPNAAVFDVAAKRSAMQCTRGEKMGSHSTRRDIGSLECSFALAVLALAVLGGLAGCGDATIGGSSPPDAGVEDDANQSDGQGGDVTADDTATDQGAEDTSVDQGMPDLVDDGDPTDGDSPDSDSDSDGGAGDDIGQDGSDTGELVCSSCHGDEFSPAPPVDTTGNTDTAERGVGAHRSHLGASTWHNEIVCEDCHVVPQTNDAPGHRDTALPAELDWSDLASASGAAPTFDGTRCASTYCHGTTLLPGGTATNPVWTQTDGTQGACGSCHSIPPEAPHMSLAEMQGAGATCSNCHSNVNEFLAFTEPARHIDGVVDVDGGGCSSCHGDDTSPAPPRDTAGSNSTGDVGVGAHRQHLGASDWHKPVECAACHLVPATVSALGHMDTPLPAELVWTGLATSDGATPSWGGTTCAGTYCHGSTLLGGGYNTEPAWTTVDGSQADCGTCHGIPPNGPHPASTDCAGCHPTILSNFTFLAPDRHIDGNVDLDLGGCVGCHGSGSDPAPPTDTSGNTDTSATGVGAHQSHLGPSNWHATLGCAECHVVPGAPGDAGHMDGTLPAELTWGPLATDDSATPNWDGTACSGTYCHGSTLTEPGATNTEPAWTAANQATCGTCHGVPPQGGHPTTGDCFLCHPDIASDMSFTDPARHINGTVDLFAMTCSTCHGGSGANNAVAPPRDTAGNSATSFVGVGAHQAHLRVGSTLTSDIVCTDCHVYPGAWDNGHIDGTPTLTWGSRATHSGGTSPAFDGANNCSNVYCHGSTMADSIANPDWTGGTAPCGSCHGLPPTSTASGPHPGSTNCSTCHPDATDAPGISDRTRHINGVVDVSSMSCTSCHGGVGSNDNAEAPPFDTSHNMATTNRGVGAHQAHLATGSNWRAAIACTACHLYPATVGAVGHNDSSLPAELVWGGIADQGTAPSWNTPAETCSGTYCHGATLIGGGSTPTWTDVGAGEADCGACHGLPPGGSHPANNACSTCHPNATDGSNPTIVPALASTHIDGILQGGGESTGTVDCGGCHADIVDRMSGSVTTDFSGTHNIASRHALQKVTWDQADAPSPSWSGPVLSSVAAASRSCTNMCHSDHPHDQMAGGEHAYNVYEDAKVRTLTAADNTDFANSGTGGLCVSCHVTPISNGRPTVTRTGFAASAHNYTDGSGYQVHDGSTFSQNCTKCHSDSEDSFGGVDSTTPFGSVHFSRYDSLLRRNALANNNTAAFLCYGCHGDGCNAANVTCGPNLEDIFGTNSGSGATGAKASRHDITVTTAADHDSVGEATTTWGDGTFSGGNRHIDCADCHNPHEAGPALHTEGENTIPNNGTLKGATGVAFTSYPGNYVATSSAHLSWVADASYEYEVCFKCHSSWAYGGTSPSGTEVAQEFNPNNASYHPVVATLAGGNSASLRAEQMANGWAVGDMVTCSDCHGNDSAVPAAQGPHGSANDFMIQGTWRSADLSSGQYNGVLCMKCHPDPRTSNGGNHVHREDGAHAIRCIGCHIAVPHGGKLARLIGDANSATMPSRYDPANQLVITGFTRASSPSNYSRSNCGTDSCTGDHPTSNGADW